MILNRSWFSTAVLGSLFFLMACFCHSLIQNEGGIVLVWVPNCIAVIWLLWRDRREWVWHLLAVFLAHLFAHYLYKNDSAFSAFSALIHCIEIVVVATLFQKIGITPGSLTVKQAFQLLCVNVSVIILLSSPLAAILLKYHLGVEIKSGWFDWAMASVMGSFLLLLPAFLLNRAAIESLLQPIQMLAMSALLLLLTLITCLIVIMLPYPFSYLALPFIIIAVSHGALRAGILANLVYVFFTIGLHEGWWIFADAFQEGGYQGVWAACAVTVFIPVILGVAVDEIKHRQSRLKALSERLTLATDSIGLGVWDWNLVSGEIYFDYRMRALYGLSANEPVSLALWQSFFSKADFTRLNSVFAGSSLHQGGFREKFQIQLKSGEVRTVQVSGLVIYEEAGQASRVVGLSWDVSDLAVAQSAVFAAEEKLGAIVESASEYAIIAMDTTGIINVFSAGAERMLGYSKQEVIRKLNPSIFHDKEEMADAARKLESEFGYAVHGIDVFVEKARKGIAEHKEWTAIRKDGSRVPINLTVTAIRDQQDVISGFLGVARDITQEKYAEKKIDVAHAVLEQQILLAKQMRDEFESLFELAPGAMIVLDEQGVIWNANGRAHDLFGYNNGYLSGLKISHLVFSNLSAPGGAVFQNAWDNQNQSDVFRARQENGDVFLANIQRSPLLVNGDAHTILIIFDVTEQKEAEQSLQRSRDLAESANKAKTEFLANMSHEIRTPLNAVLGTAQLLNFTGLNAKQHHYVSMIMESGQALSAILNDVLDISKIEAGKMELSCESFQLSKVLNALSTIMAAYAAGKNLELTIETQPDLPECWVGDSLRLQQILVNLAGNAIKFTSEGEVMVTLSQFVLDHQNVGIEVRVRDTGIGMTKAQQGKLFQAFSQADNSITRRFGGTGLGLIITQKLIKLMHGQIIVESDYGRGTEFICRIPMRDCMEQEGDIVSETLWMEQVNRKVLIVDHHDVSRQTLIGAAMNIGWFVDDCISVDLAMDILLSSNVEYGLLIYNHHLPGVSILEKVCHRLPCIRVSSELEKPGSDYIVSLPKPVTRSHLMDAMKKAFILFNKDSLVMCDVSKNTERDILRGKMILLVEDNELNQMVALGILEELGCQVIIANHGEECIKILCDPVNRFDLILMDVQMPIMDGFTATRKIRKELLVKTPVIAMTAGVLAFERQQCIESGMSDFIGKPIDFDVMIDTLVRNLTDEQTVITDAHLSGDKVEEREQVVFDPERVLKLARGKPKRERTIIGMIEKIVSARLLPVKKGRDLVAREEWKAVSMHFHSLKGEFGNFGANQVCFLAEKIELAVKQNQVHQLPELLDAFEECLQATLKSAACWLQQYHAGKQALV